MNIDYVNVRVKKIFTDYNLMQKRLPFNWVRTIKKHIIRLEAADNFGDFLKLGLGKPEHLSGYSDIRYSLHIAANTRLIIILDTSSDLIHACNKIIIIGVCDYHGNKENWFIS